MTTPIVESLRRLVRDCDVLDMRWALIGGLAVSARAEPRFTRDVDICVVVDDDAAAEATVRQLAGLGYVVDSLVEHGYVDRLATVRLWAPLRDGVVIDLLFASSGIEAEIAREAERLDLVPGLVVPIARAGHVVTGGCRTFNRRCGIHRVTDKRGRRAPTHLKVWGGPLVAVAPTHREPVAQREERGVGLRALAR